MGYPFMRPGEESFPDEAQQIISDLRAQAITDDMSSCLNADVRRVAKQIIGKNLTFSDDDLRLLAALAVAAIDADLHRKLSDKVLVESIDNAKIARIAKDGEGMV